MKRILEASIKKAIFQARHTPVLNESLLKLRTALREIGNPHSAQGFHTWWDGITNQLGQQECRNIGIEVCKNEGFFLEEADFLYSQIQAGTKGKPLVAFPRMGYYFRIVPEELIVNGNNWTNQRVIVLSTYNGEKKEIHVYCPEHHQYAWIDANHITYDTQK